MSDFGRGFAVCIVQYLFHEPKLEDNLALYASMRQRYPHDRWFSEDQGVVMWADGAVDHLRDLIRPRRGITKAEWQEARALVSRMFAAKWGGRFADDGPAMDVGEARTTIGRFRDLLASVARRVGHEPPTTIEQAKALDTALGLKVEDREGYCSAPLERRYA